MSTEVEIDTSVLDQMDFEPTCEIEWLNWMTGNRKGCENTAEYLMTFYSHATDEVRTKLACQSCVDWAQNHGEVCPKCISQGGVIRELKPLG